MKPSAEVSVALAIIRAILRLECFVLRLVQVVFFSVAYLAPVLDIQVDQTKVWVTGRVPSE